MSYKALIVLILIGGMAIIGASIMVGIEKREVVVVAEPYETGLRYDAMRKRLAELGWTVSLPQSLGERASAMDMKVLDGRGSPLEDAKVSVYANRMGSTDIKAYQGVYMGGGKYQAPVVFDLKGYWDIKVTVSRGDDTFSFDDKIEIKG